MFVQLLCKDRNQKEKDELYQVLAALAHREQLQIEERGDIVELDVCPQGKIQVSEEGRQVIMSANTRHGGPGFHAFCVDLFLDIQHELPGDYELIDDLELDKDGNFHRIFHLYEDEVEYLRGELVRKRPLYYKNYLYDSTFFLPLEKENAVATPIGYLDTKEFIHMDPEDLMDNFFVWNTWDKTAQYYKNTALLLMAKEGYGPFALMNDHTLKMAHLICDYLEIAFQKDPSLTYPVKEYRNYISLLGRFDRLQNAKSMEQEVFQYRLQEVYHLFDNAKVVAFGACERSFDPVLEAMCLMSPRTEEHAWDYFIQVSKKPMICSSIPELEKQDPIPYQGKSIWILVHEEEGFPMIDAKIRQLDEELYFHIVFKEENQKDYLIRCIKESGFVQENL